MYNIIESNKAEYGGGIFCDDNSTPRIIKNRIINNTATHNQSLAGAGGGIYCYQSDPEIIDNVINSNTAQFGGGIYVYLAKPIISDNKIQNNTANFGGGIFCDNDGKPEITNNLITNNQALEATGDDPMAGGGGIYSNESDPIITDNQILNNSADYFGGGIYCYNSIPQIKHNKINQNTAGMDGGGVFCDAETYGVIEENQINNNKATGSGGGGIYLDRSPTRVSNNRITSNTAGAYGGGIYCYNSSVNITNNQITNNTSGGHGAGIFCDKQVGGKIINNVLAYNQVGRSNSAGFGGGVYVNDYSELLQLANNITSNNKLVSTYGAGQELFVSPPGELPIFYNDLHHNLPPELAYSAYYGWSAYPPYPKQGTGNVNVDPKFQDSAKGDYHLKQGSLCINWGDPNPSDNDPNGTRNDMGNYGGPLAKAVLKAEAGYDQVVSTNTVVSLDGTWSSYPNGINLFSCQWTKIEGNPVTITNPTNLEASFTPTQEGTYVFKLTITADGNTSSDEVTVWVEQDSFPPYQAIDFGGKTYTDITYDKNGNMVTLGGRQIAYDYENRPTTIVMPTEAGKVITYTYDYTGQRVKKEVRDKDKQEQKLTQQAEKLEKAGKTRLAEAIEKAILQLALSKSKKPSPPKPGPKPSQSEVTYYIGNLYEVGNSSTATIVTKYIYANGQRVASVSSKPKGLPTIQYYHSDHLGSANIITDAQGNKIQLLEYIPFGETRLSQGTATVDYRFTGQMLDNDAGLYYYGARWYEPVIGKFITPDTIIQAPYDPQSLNRYAYCRNNPVKYIDPTGNYFGESVVNAVLGFLGLGGKDGKGATNPEGPSQGKSNATLTKGQNSTIVPVTSKEGKQSSGEKAKGKGEEADGEDTEDTPWYRIDFKKAQKIADELLDKR